MLYHPTSGPSLALLWLFFPWLGAISCAKTSKIHGSECRSLLPIRDMLLQATKGPIRNTTAFGAPGVRFKNKRLGSADTDPGAAGEEFLVRRTTPP